MENVLRFAQQQIVQTDLCKIVLKVLLMRKKCCPWNTRRRKLINLFLRLDEREKKRRR